MRQLRVLSLDWDFFVKATMEQRVHLFPDTPNELYPKFLQETIWISRYVASGQLRNIKVDRTIFTKTLEYLTDCLAFAPDISVCESHSKAYEVIIQKFNDKKHSGIDLVNLDFHHDLYSSGESLDCGNWVYKLRELYSHKLNYDWVKREDSELISEDNGYNKTNILTFDEFLNCDNKWDIIFICRSGMWSPPHLDNHFLVMCKYLLPTLQYKALKKLLPNRYNMNLKDRIRFMKERNNEIFKTANELNALIT